MGLFRRKSADRPAPEVAASPKPVGNTSAVHAGVPGRCPDCGGFGYIDQIDMKYNFQSQHCRDCGRVWEFRFDHAGDVIDLTDPAPRPVRDSGRG